jgi:hypothetical protein
MTGSRPGRASDVSSRVARFVRRTIRPAALRLEMAEAALFFRFRPEQRATHQPDFLGIGGQKCGTTWLDSMLRQHPDVGLPRRKEVHFFDGNFWRGLDWYRFQFRGLKSRIRGEFTPAYSILPVSRIREVAALNPAMRLVLVVRHPVERAWSHVEMGMIRNRRRTIAQVAEADLLRQIESPGVLDRSRFSVILRHWLEVFPPSQLHIEVFENIEREPRALLTRVLTHIGADPGRMPWEQLRLNERLNANAGREIPARCHERLRELLADEIRALGELLPRPEILSWKP